MFANLFSALRPLVGGQRSHPEEKPNKMQTSITKHPQTGRRGGWLEYPNLKLKTRKSRALTYLWGSALNMTMVRPVEIVTRDNKVKKYCPIGDIRGCETTNADWAGNLNYTTMT